MNKKPMEYKRIELYVWWTCNQKCTYCIEFPNMEISWKNKVSKEGILKQLVFYKKKWYNHVTYLWWEPFIQPVFYDALRIWKKLWYTVLVSTNCTTLHIDSQAIKFLPYIDELFLSFQALSIPDQQKISRTFNYVHWDKVFENISRYWRWSMLKVNIVITKDNLYLLTDMLNYLIKKWIWEISITYPDVAFDYYGIDFIKTKIAPSYSDCIRILIPIITLCKKEWIRLKIPDIPFCIFRQYWIEDFLYLTEEVDYATRVKVNNFWNQEDRQDLSNYRLFPRKRKHCWKCSLCQYNDVCWGPSKYYYQLFWFDEIIPS